jgi:predicted methyltransferase
MKSQIVFLGLAAALALNQTHATESPDSVASAVADRTRPADDVKLDGTRKPAGVLAFAGVHSGEVVAEYLPGGGYYTRLLSDIVGPSGHVYALETTRWGKDNIDATKTAVQGHANVSLNLSPLGEFKLPAKVDAFWTTDNYHDLHIAKYATIDMHAFNRHVFESLKPGGLYVIVDHAGAPGIDDATISKLHRIDRAEVISEVTAAGFKLDGESDVLRNAADDHTKVVFDPSIRWKTDQFVLKFKKPG